MKKIAYILSLCFFLCQSDILAQGYQKDSLQIKVYTEIIYTNSIARDIKVKKVFCDYCSKFQAKMIKEEAIRRSYDVRNDRENKMVNGTKKLALYIRISKKDFAALKEEEDN